MPTFATPEPITATVGTAGARVRVVAGDRPDTNVLVEPINSASATDVKVAESTKVRFSAGELSIKTTKSGDRNGSVAITIELPVGSRLVLSAAWSDVHAEGRLGDCQLDMASGQIQLDHIAALRASLAATSVSIAHVDGTATIQGSSGGLRIGEVTGPLTYAGSSGQVWIGHARSDVELTNAKGRFDIDRAEGSVTATSADCPVRIGRMTRGRAKLMTSSGGIDIGISEGTAAWVDARSTKGTVRSSLTAQDNPDGFDTTVQVYARTRHDDIVIHRATV